MKELPTRRRTQSKIVRGPSFTALVFIKRRPGHQEEDEEDVAECRWGTRSLERGHPPHCPPLHSATRLCCLINNGKIIFEEIPEAVNQVYHWHELFASPDPGPRMLSRVRMRPADICIQNTLRPRAKEIGFWLRR